MLRQAFVVLASACAAEDTVEVTFDPCAPLAIAVVSEHAEDAFAVEAAVATWGHVLPAMHAALVAAAPGVLTIRFPSGIHGTRGMYWDAVGVIEISRDMLAPEAYPFAIAHELGHAFGMLHVEARPSVMNVGNVSVAPTAEDAAEVIARWSSCRR